MDSGTRAMLAASAVLFMSGLFHTLVWLILGGPWQGVITWRKPILFGFSGALTTLSLAYIQSWLPHNARRRRWCKVYAVSSTLEIAMVTIQIWRGVPAHYNLSTAIDTVMSSVMISLALMLSIPVLVWTRQTARSDISPRDRKWAMLLALLAMDLGLLLGPVLATDATLTRLAGSDPTSESYVAVFKLPHAIALHGLQIFLVLGWALRKWVRSSSTRRRLLSLIGLGFFLLVGAFIVSALTQRL